LVGFASAILRRAFYPKFMKTRFVVAVVAGFIWLNLPSAWGFLPPAIEPLANFDKRTVTANSSTPAANADTAWAAASATLKDAVPDVRISRDELLGTPAYISATHGFLTGPGGSGKGVSGAALAALPAGDPHRVVKAFLNEHATLFGHNAQVLSSARIQRDYVTEHNGLRTTVWQQVLDGIPVFDGLLVGHVTKNAELVNLSSHFVPDALQAANAGNPNRSALIAAPAVPCAKAIAAAAASINVNVAEDAIRFSGSPEGADKSQSANASGLFGAVTARLVWLPFSPQSMRLCWQVVVGSEAPAGHFLVLVDAQSGEVLLRRSLTAHLETATYNVYTSDSPSPFSPGWPTPQTEQPSNTTRVLVTLSALDTNASPAGWIADGTRQTSGNNAIAFLDRDFTATPDFPLPQATGTNRVFDFPLNLAQAPLSYASAATVQLFYEANWYHDRLYQLGFTEAAGNFQVNNFGRGGFGNDNIVCLVQAGADIGYTDNAFFSTLPDGENSYCAMFVFSGPTPDRDGSLDEEVVCHELTHGLSNRLLGGGVGISQLQTAGMGEGWSDFYSLCLLSEPGDDPNGVYAEGGYATYQLGGPDFEENYYYGIRRYPYTRDMSKNPLTFKDIDPTRASAHLGVPISPLFGGGDPSEVHNSGEVWCVTLREMWANLVEKSGWTNGNHLALQLVTDGLKLAPANATFLEARDAIIQADLLDTGGDNYAEIWIAFAKRGMGYSAICPSSETTTGVFEAFDLPPDLGTPDGILEVRVTPPSFEAMFAGETNTIFVRVTDAFAVTNATIAATLSNGANLLFRNDGVAPDIAPNNAVYTASLNVPTNLSSIALTLVVSAPGKDTMTNIVTYFIVPLPLNDNFASATKVPAAGTNYLTNNKRAGLETNEPAHGNIGSAAGSLWWNYTPAVNTNVLVDTGGSAVRTIVAVYTNNTLVNLQAIASSAGTLTRPGAYVNFSARAGVTYHVAVAGYDPRNLGTLNVTIAPGAQADTNAPSLTIASPVSGQVVTTNRLVISGSASDPSPNASGIRDITIRVVPIPGFQETTTVVSSLTGPLNTNWVSIIGLQPGLNSVQVSATDFAGNQSVASKLQITYRILDPLNDFFANAIVLTNSSGTNSVNTIDATKEAGEPNHAGSFGGHSAWWSFVAPADGLLTISTIGSTFDTVMGLYTGSSVGQLTAIVSNDDVYDGVPGGYSQIVQAVRSNLTYRIAVDGYDGQSGAAFLSYSFVSMPIFRLTVNATTGGTATPSLLDVQSNSIVVVTANPSLNYQFDIWDGAVLSLNNPLSVLVTADMDLTAHFRLAEFTDDFETGDLLHVNWGAGGNKPWIVQSSVVDVGQYSARSGNIANNQNSSLLLTANFRAGSGSFDRRVSSEPGFDVLKFYIDGMLQQQWSGEVAWAGYTFSLTSGNHTLEWRYTKDPNGAAGLDAAFIDNVNLPLVVPTDSSSAASLKVERQTDGAFFIDLLGQANQQYILQTSTNLIDWQNQSTNVATGGFLRISDSSATNSIRFYRAIAWPQ
jgi:hypothetical protein